MFTIRIFFDIQNLLLVVKFRINEVLDTFFELNLLLVINLSFLDNLLFSSGRNVVSNFKNFIYFFGVRIPGGDHRLWWDNCFVIWGLVTTKFDGAIHETLIGDFRLWRSYVLMLHRDNFIHVIILKLDFKFIKKVIDIALVDSTLRLISIRQNQIILMSHFIIRTLWRQLRLVLI